MENIYIQSTLNAQQAFEAMQAGKNVVCKAFGNTYDTLDNFPATVFFKPDYEFAIALQTIALNGITFTTPLTLPELEDNQDIFIVSASSIKKVQFKGQVEVLTAVKNGFAQRDEDNAKDHLKAICLSFGVTDPSIIIEGVFNAPKKRPPRKSTPETPEQPEQEVIKEEQLYPENVDVPEPSQIEKIVADIANTSIQKTTNDDLDELIPNTGSLATDQVLDESNSVIQKFISAIDKCTSDYELSGVERNLDGNKNKLNISEFDALAIRINEKRESFITSKQPEPSFIPSYDSEADDTSGELVPAVSKVDEIKAVILNANSDADLANASGQILANARYLSTTDLGELQSLHMKREELIKLKADLIQRASVANTPAEANALITYTKSWDEFDRKPVLDAINARLCALGKPEIEQQSLLVRIQNCLLEFDLEKFLPEINALDPEIRPRMQQIYTSKMKELSELPF